ncbi:General transcription and DNA repair factor IIH subunit TFB2 [Cocos nucifera]|uniref:RNA polymerase II transcription factor B subunit 2 n=1 Tax=Cocos nucifera TaxID=13894 RepID=A0A8K0N6J5_COCNU|nr:General transcription and DNA repair factor IIH subunit TFB2 [Cocos nucifera]
MPEVRIVAKNFMDMVAALPAMKLDKLYGSTFICEAVLRSLPPLAKKYVLQMLFVDSPVTAKSMEEWLLADGYSKHKVSIDRLLQLRVFLEVNDSGTLPREPMPLSVTVRLPTLEDLEAYALEQWECFLLQLINSSQAERSTSFSSSMMRVFQRALLSARENEAPKLTENGFQFLLMDTNAQLWYIIREYISSSEDRGVDQTDLICFLLELSFHTLGEAYNLNTLTDVQKHAIKDLADLGLVKLQQGRKESWFIPTKLATNLSVSLSDSSSRKEIISFLQQNVHPRVATKTPVVPENVTDQIRLWETDRNRVEMIPSHLYEDFPSKDIFEAACDFAREIGGLLWEDSKKMSAIYLQDEGTATGRKECSVVHLEKS